METDSEVAQMIELREKNVKIVMINILHMSKHVHGSMNSFRRDRDDIKKKTHEELLKMRNTMSKMKSTLNEINSRPDTSEEKN